MVQHPLCNFFNKRRLSRGNMGHHAKFFFEIKISCCEWLCDRHVFFILKNACRVMMHDILKRHLYKPYNFSHISLPIFPPLPFHSTRFFHFFLHAPFILLVFFIFPYINFFFIILVLDWLHFPIFEVKIFQQYNFYPLLFIFYQGNNLSYVNICLYQIYYIII